MPVEEDPEQLSDEELDRILAELEAEETDVSRLRRRLHDRLHHPSRGAIDHLEALFAVSAQHDDDPGRIGREDHAQRHRPQRDGDPRRVQGDAGRQPVGLANSRVTARGQGEP